MKGFIRAEEITMNIYRKGHTTLFTAGLKIILRKYFSAETLYLNTCKLIRSQFSNCCALQLLEEAQIL